MVKIDERETFRQMALKMAKYRLRKVMNDVGCTPQEIREAEVEGEDQMIEIIMTKYDEGEINLPGLEKARGSAAVKEEPEKEEPRKAKREKKKKDDDDDDPYSSAFDDEDNPSDDEDGPHGKGDDGEDDVENHEADPPRKAGRKAGRKARHTEEPTSDFSAIEEKLDKLLDITVSVVETSLETREVLDQHIAASNLFHEIVKMAFSRIWKLGVANPLKPGFGDVIKKARLALGLLEEESQDD